MQLDPSNGQSEQDTKAFIGVCFLSMSTKNIKYRAASASCCCDDVDPTHLSVLMLANVQLASDLKRIPVYDLQVQY